MRKAMLFIALAMLWMVNPDISYSDTVQDSKTSNIETGQDAYASQQVEIERLRLNSKAPIDIILTGTGAVRYADFRVQSPAEIGDDNLARARWFLNEYRKLLRIENPKDELRFFRRSPDGFNSFFLQFHDDIPVFPSELGVHTDSKYITGLGGNYVPQIKTSSKPAITPQQAAEKALIAGGKGAVQKGEPELWYINRGILGLEDDATYLAWRIEISAPKGSKALYIDAHNGTTVYTENLSPKAFDLMLSNANTTGPCDADSSYWLNENRDILVADENGPNGSSNDEGRRAFHNIQRVYNYWNQELGRDSFDACGRNIEMYINAGNSSLPWFDIPWLNFPWFNAQFNPGCGEIFEFGSGMALLDIIGHEFTHGVINNARENDRGQYKRVLHYELESGALNESYADIFAYFVDNDDWWIGDEYTFTGIGRRSLSDPRLGMQPDHMGNFWRLPVGELPGDDNDHGYVHINSGIHNKAAYLIINGGTHNGLNIIGIGQSKAQRLFYQVLVRGLTLNSQFLDAKLETIRQASILISSPEPMPLSYKCGDTVRTSTIPATDRFTLSDVCNIHKAFASVGIGSEVACVDNDKDGHLDDFDNCPEIPNSDQTDSDNDGFGNACDRCPYIPGNPPEDTDKDGRADSCDNCVDKANPSQEDTDGDRRGNACDNCPTVYNWYNGKGQDDADGDGIGDYCDNCKSVANPDQMDMPDRDGLGNACDPDWDNDGKKNDEDNCPLVANPAQEDTDGDEIGNACDNCPLVPNNDQKDLDCNGIGDACDSFPNPFASCTGRELPAAIDKRPEFLQKIEWPKWIIRLWEKVWR